VNSQTVDLGFRPRPWQTIALSSLKRFSVLIVHRRGGKTLAAVMKLIDAALRCQKIRGQYAYIAPELKQAKGLAWDYLKHYALKVPGSSHNESELWVKFPNGARIRLYGADAPDSLRGFYFDGVVLDEVAQMRPFVWGEILVPALADRTGWCMFIGTPKGINLLSERYYSAEVDPTWYAQRFDITQTGALDEAELAKMRANMTDQQWRQEMLCDFDASSDETLISIDLVRQALGRYLPPEAYESEPKIIGVDVALGGGDKTVIQRRQGLLAYPADVHNLSDPHQIGDIVAHTIDVFQPDAVFIDNSGGYGSGVISRLSALQYKVVVGIQFGGMPIEAGYANRRTEMWWKTRLWLEHGSLPRDQRYLVDLTGPRYDYKNAAGKLALETKDQMRARGIHSPDMGDALALTFAAPVAAANRIINGLPAQVAHVYRAPLSGDYQSNGAIEVAMGASMHKRGTDYDPFAAFAEEQKRHFGG
jgi:hypothetical protein